MQGHIDSSILVISHVSLMPAGALPIPGVKNAKQVEEVAGALGWRLSSEQVADLDRASSKIPRSTGAPFENW